MDLKGPLSQIWLASNFEKKLSKQQFLNTDLVESSKLLDNSITLRLSGQLLLGIVKIYSRKTKYLLDDVQDILYKLKHSFKLATGTTLDSNVTSRNIVNVNQVILPDRITDHDLLYQKDFEFEDDGIPDLSVELGRRDDEEIVDNFEFSNFDNFDVDLDFDLEDSIEIGRDADRHIGEQSILDLGHDIPPLELKAPTTIPSEVTAPVETVTETTPRQRIKKTGLMENGIKTNKRKLQIDTELTIPIEDLKSLQNLQLQANWRDQYINIKLSDREKCDLINELCGKRMKLDLDNTLVELSHQLSQREKELNPEDQTQDIDPGFDSMAIDDNDFAFDDLNFDLSMHHEPEVIDLQIDATESTTQISNVIQKSQEPTFKTVMEDDLQNPVPLGTITTNTVSMKRQASKCFFELLVLATSDKISLNQQPQETEIGGDIAITAKEKLFF
ncbi:sister chromatid cohesion protein 1 [[Candida] jaroonii]|uniref:Sister chromatid cohesion protein 1 n=1 Tax=[Candida] jaroonii TaxID=467808 RepID=A0ACA9Y8R2_9ASCO|nr:sister chromatid cohesion protein 1 [[Candida] jaroonii]